MTRPTILLNPGPVTLSDRVRAALTREDLCHREAEFAVLLRDVRRRLASVYPAAAASHEAICLAGSGTAAVEGMLQSFAPGAGRTLVAANGVYGERMAAMLDAAGKRPLVVRSSWLEPIDVEGVSRAIETNDDVTHVLAVHNETSSGRLNDIAALGELCRRTGRSLLLDAVSSFGAEELFFEEWNLIALASTANKCLHAPPGVSFVLAGRDLLDAGKSHATSLYLDLFRYRDAQRRGSSPFTSAVHVLFALQEALHEFEEAGGVHARRARYAKLSGIVQLRLARLGVETLLAKGDRSSMISAFRLPEGIRYGELHDGLKQRGFVIYAGQGPLEDEIFRIATMGDLQDEDMERFLTALDELLA